MFFCIFELNCLPLENTVHYFALLLMGVFMLTDINLEIFSSPGKGGCITTRNILEIELPEWKKLFSYY